MFGTLVRLAFISAVNVTEAIKRIYTMGTHFILQSRRGEAVRSVHIVVPGEVDGIFKFETPAHQRYT